MNTVISNGKKIVAAFVAMTMLFLLLTSYSSVNVSAVNTSKGYTVFDAMTGESVSNYVLDSNPYVDNSRVVIGTDEREQDYTLSGVVHIRMRKANSYSSSTGFIVDAHTIATAAHCVFNTKGTTSAGYQNLGERVDQITIHDINGNTIKTITEAYDIHVPNAFITNYLTYGSSAIEYYPYDYALITVADDLSEYACFNLGVMTDDIINSTQKVYCTGYPADLQLIKHTGWGYIVSDIEGEEPERRFCHTVDTGSANSGSPVYVKTQYMDKTTNQVTEYLTVIGINTCHVDKDENGVYRKNGGVQMTTETLHFYKNNPYIEWGE